MSDQNQKIDENAASDSVQMSKVDIIGQVVKHLDGMTINDLSAWHNDAVAKSKTYASTVGDFAGRNKSSVDMKGTAKGAVKEEVEALFAGQEDLPEDFRFKAVTLFESAVATRLALELVEARQELEEKFEEALNEVREELTERAEKYLEAAASAWLEENQVAVETSLEVERNRQFVDSLRGLLADFHVDLPEEKTDALAEAEAYIQEQDAALNEAVAHAIELAEELKRRDALEIFNKVAEGLAMTQVEELKKLVEDVEVDDELEARLTVIRDAHFKPGVKEEKAQKVGKEVLGEEMVVVVEGNDGEPAAPKVIDESMKPYVNALRTLIR
jgi:hypothetical protein